MGTRYKVQLFGVGIVLCLCGFIQTGQAGWGDWTPWTPCSATCGNGVQTRMRHCTQEPGDASVCIYANKTEEYQCYSGKNCDPIDGGWSFWEPWSNCSRRCGVGSHERWRKCDNPKPQYGGKVCEGTSHEVEKCTHPACPPLYFGETKTECRAGAVLCANGVQCIAEFRRCDFWRDCADGSDESACKEGEPVQIFYQNNSGISVRMSSFAFPLLSSGFAVWFSVNRR